ncbi:MAG: hypothetical protein QNK37_15065 [Acidobacteriota bacterium]|nr:hypothetical protein [Acidobacteriota bacterium]
MPSNHVPEREKALLQEINKALPVGLLERSQVLIAKRQAYTLGENEREELIRITDTIEELGAQRLANLAELAQLRGMDLEALMDQLEIFPASHG